jgi:hypothetical protein
VRRGAGYSHPSAAGNIRPLTRQEKIRRCGPNPSEPSNPIQLGTAGTCQRRAARYAAAAGQGGGRGDRTKALRREGAVVSQHVSGRVVRRAQPERAETSAVVPSREKRCCKTRPCCAEGSEPGTYLKTRRQRVTGPGTRLPVKCCLVMAAVRQPGARSQVTGCWKPLTAASKPEVMRESGCRE